MSQGARVVVIERTPNLELDYEPYPEIRKYADLLCMDLARHTAKPLPARARCAMRWTGPISLTIAMSLSICLDCAPMPWRGFPMA